METTYNNATSSAATHTGNGFWAISRKMLSEHRRGILSATLAYLGLWIAVGLFWGIVGLYDSETIILFYLLIGSIGALAFASMMFSDMKTKEGRLAVLMLPATTAAKFWPRVIAASLGTIVVMIAGIFCEEIGRLLGNLIMRRHNDFFEFVSIPENFIDDTYSITMLIAVALMQLSIYFYGAILWPKSSFIKTTVVLVCVSMLISTVGGIIISSILYHGYRFELLVSENTLFWIVFSVVIAISALFIWLAYRRFKSSTLMYGLRQK